MNAITPIKRQTSPELSRAMRAVALEIMGDKLNVAQSSQDELRFGTNGSLSVDLIKGTFFANDPAVNAGGGVIDFVMRYKHLDKVAAKVWLQDRGHMPKPSPRVRVVATYDYHDETGSPLFQVRRMEPKNFIQAAADGRGGWATGKGCMGGVQRVPYRLPAVIAAVAAGNIVFIAEGEKGANALESIGLVGTCSSGGAGKWRAEYNRTFAGANVVILPDNDQPGRDHAADVAKHLRRVANSVRVVMLPGLEPKGDVADWIDAGGTREAMEALLPAAAICEPLVEFGLPSPEPHQWDDEPSAEWLDPNGPAPDFDDRLIEIADAPSSEKSHADKPWTEYLQRGDDGEPINNLANVATALRSAPGLKGCFRFDEMKRVAVLTLPLPKGNPGILPRPVRDTDVSITQEHIQRNELRRAGADVVRQAVALVAEEDAFHPVREYLNGLRWDRKPRLGTWLAYYAGCEPDENLSAEEKEGQRQYISAIGRMFLISMVARVMRPGCKVDYMLILEGKQGARKSTVGEILGGEWFSDSLPDIGSDAVRLSQHLRGKWLIEIGELSAMSKTETGALKDFLVRKEEKFTPKYGHMDVVEPRQCVFFGTTNKSTYLRDETGARRFWPVEAGTIDVIALAEDRDQLLAEAVNAYRGGEQWWPDSDFEKQFIQPQQEARHEADAWEQAIGEWLATNPDNVTILKVARLGLSIETPRLGTADQRRISAALERLGWQRGSVVNGVQKWIQKGLNQ